MPLKMMFALIRETLWTVKVAKIFNLNINRQQNLHYKKFWIIHCERAKVFAVVSFNKPTLRVVISGIKFFSRQNVKSTQTFNKWNIIEERRKKMSLINSLKSWNGRKRVCKVPETRGSRDNVFPSLSSLWTPAKIRWKFV